MEPQRRVPALAPHSTPTSPEHDISSTTLGRIKRRLKTSLIHSYGTAVAFHAYLYDARRYLRHSSTRGPFATQANLSAKITERYHNVEKGLALPSPRPGFGAARVRSLTDLTHRYLTEYGEDDLTRAAIGTLVAYSAFHHDHGISDHEIPEGDRIAHLANRHAYNPAGLSGTRSMSRAEIQAAVSGVGIDFFTSRHSTRVFESTSVDSDDVAVATAAALAAPAVCNRQFARVRTWNDRREIDQILEIQGGARGFSDRVPALAMITVSLRSYWSAAERNQCWIDGGLFAMNFMLGLHARGLGSVPLNWSKEPSRDRLIRKAVPDLSDSDSIVMFVAFGHLPDEYQVAASPRLVAHGT